MFEGTGSNKGLHFHFCRSLLLVLLSIVCLPVSILITLLAVILHTVGLFNSIGDHASTQTNSPKRVLITGVSMEKGLFLARTMYLGGCIVFGADFSHGLNLQCGRFSRAIHEFTTFKNPVQHGIEVYIEQVVRFIQREKIDLWISCSGVATAIEDARLAHAIERRTSCKAFQLNEHAVSILDDKMKFMEHTTELGLSGLQWHSLTGLKDVDKFVQQQQQSATRSRTTKFIVKSANMDDSSRGALPIMNLKALEDMRRILSGLEFTNDRVWILQEYVDSGEEYCTQAVVVDDRITAFTACRSASVLMHYVQLDPESILFRKMLSFTHDYIRGTSKKTGPLTGHISFDFLIQYQETASGFEATMAPIECNPRCHTATVLFRGSQRDLAKCYLSSLHQQPSCMALIGNPVPQPGFFWTAHDFVTLVILPLLQLVSRPSLKLLAESFRRRAEFFVHLINWKDPTFEWWDPLPWLVLNHLYWPFQLALAAFSGMRWKELNVSTTKIFQC